MATQSSASSNGLILHPQSSYTNSSLPFGLHCLTFKPGSLVFNSFTITLFLLPLPLSIFVLYCGLQRWQQRQQRSSSRAASHSESFGYHLATMELGSVFGSLIGCCGIYSNKFSMLFVWYYLYSIAWYGKLFFHLLTCVEHYLAVVHPITYLSLKKERWIRIRNIIVGCIWLFCFGPNVLIRFNNLCVGVNFWLLVSAIVTISFCSLSVLYVLVHPGPGEQGNDRARVHQSKARAFYTILAILGVLLLRCVWTLVWTGTDVLNVYWINECVGIMCEIWIQLPSSLVSPLLFLQRVGTSACCKNNVK